MKLLGKRILVAKPEVKTTTESGLHLPESAVETTDQERLKRWSKLDVFAVGDECEKVKAGDKVYVGVSIQHAELMEVEGKLYFLLNEMQVSIIW